MPTVTESPRGNTWPCRSCESPFPAAELDEEGICATCNAMILEACRKVPHVAVALAELEQIEAEMLRKLREGLGEVREGLERISQVAGEVIHFSRDAEGLDVIEKGPSGSQCPCPRCGALYRSGEPVLR